MNNIVKEINEISREYPYLEFKILSFEKGLLIIAASEDFCYYHNFELHFEDVFSIIGNFNWTIDTKIDFLQIITSNNIGRALNKKYKVEIGYNIFSFAAEYEITNYIVAQSILLKNNIVKYSINAPPSY